MSNSQANQHELDRKPFFRTFFLLWLSLCVFNSSILLVMINMCPGFYGLFSLSAFAPLPHLLIVQFHMPAQNRMAKRKKNNNNTQSYSHFIANSFCRILLFYAFEIATMCCCHIHFCCVPLFYDIQIYFCLVHSVWFFPSHTCLFNSNKYILSGDSTHIHTHSVDSFLHAFMTAKQNIKEEKKNTHRKTTAKIKF